MHILSLGYMKYKAPFFLTHRLYFENPVHLKILELA